MSGRPSSSGVVGGREPKIHYKTVSFFHYKVEFIFQARFPPGLACLLTLTSTSPDSSDLSVFVSTPSLLLAGE